MTNIEKLNEKGMLTEFVLDYTDANNIATWKDFKNKYKIKDNMSVSKWLLADVEEPRLAPGTRVKKTYTRMKDNAPFVIYGTVTQVISDTKGEHILVEWDDIESFKTMEVIGQDSVEVAE